MNSFHSYQRLRLGVQGPGVFWNSVPGNTKCHPSILNSRQMALKLWLIVHLRKRSLTIGGGGGRAGKFWGRDAIFWAPTWGGLKLSEPAWGEGYNFLGAFGRCARTNGFCVTAILSTAWNTMAVQALLTELHTQSWIARLKSTLIGWRWGVTSRGIACNLLDFEMALKTAHGNYEYRDWELKAQQNRRMN